MLIIGATGGIGSAVARAAAAAGWRLLLHGRGKGAGALSPTLPGDLNEWAEDPESIPALEPVQAVVWCAGVCELLPGQLLTRKALRRTFSINLEAPLVVLSALYRRGILADGARVVLVGSQSAHAAGEGFSAYAASKAGLAAAARVLDLEFARRGVRVMCIEPATVDTAMTRRLIATFGGLKGGHDQSMLSPEGVAAQILGALDA